MPRIDPIQLLNCLNVLLSPNGGIKSRDEVQRLASLMTKFSKKLVSKCIYIQILKCTETELLGLFMGSGGWFLVHVWLTESIVAKNWPLVKELLELLLLCPVDIERLKTNNCPKLVKELSKDGNHFAIRALASKLVEQWLKSVKGEQVIPISINEIPQIIDSQLESHPEINAKPEPINKIEEPVAIKDIDTKLTNNIQENSVISKDVAVEDKDVVDVKSKDIVNGEPEILPVLKISLKDGKQTVSQVKDTDTKNEDVSTSEKLEKNKKSKDKSSDKHSNSSKSSSSKDSSKSHSSSEKHKSSHRSSSSSSRRSSKDKSKDKERHSSHGSRSKSESSSKKSSSSSSSSSTKSRDDSKSSEKEKSKEKAKDKEDKTLKSKDKDVVSTKSPTDKDSDKSQVPSIHKLGKIPKLSDVKKDKPSISIEVRKPDEPKPKTVKTFNSKFRKHGLEEEVKPPPSRAAVLTKKPAPAALPAAPPKRPSPVHQDMPPEKRPRPVEPVEKPGAIKLIPPKPKPMLLLESDMFMDALNASATNKKEPKKRKRRTSGSKDGNPQNENSPPHTPTAITSPTSESKSVPPRFYQDTLDTEETSKDKTSNVKVAEKTENVETEMPEKDIEKMDTSEPHTATVNGLKGVLCYHKRKGPKKSIKWKPDSELEEIQYFELDETERVNVTKTFTDMKYLERIHEREAFQKARNLINDDVMEEKTSWKALILVDAEGQIEVEYGKNSKEKDIQAIRQKGTLQPLYFHKSMIPDSPLEAEPETHPHSEPTIIPLEDVTGNVSNFRNMPWPEPKGNAPPAMTSANVPPMFPTNINQFPNNFPTPQFPGVPAFQGPNMVPGDWPPGVPPHLMGNGMPGPMPPPVMAPGALPPGAVPPPLMMAPENMMMSPEMFGAPNGMFPMPPEGFNMQPNMFAMNFNMQGPPAPEFAGPNNFRGGMRGRGGAGWQGKGAWEGPPRGRGAGRGARKAVCIYFQRKGSCRQGDNCSFLHPGVNGPF